MVFSKYLLTAVGFSSLKSKRHFSASSFLPHRDWYHSDLMSFGDVSSYASVWRFIDIFSLSFDVNVVYGFGFAI